MLPYMSIMERALLEFVLILAALFALASVILPMLMDYRMYKKMRPWFTGLTIISLSMALTAAILLEVWI